VIGGVAGLAAARSLVGFIQVSVSDAVVHRRLLEVVHLLRSPLALIHRRS